MEIGNSGYNLVDFDHFRSEILAELRRVKYHDLEDMVCRMGKTYDETMEVLDRKCTSTTSIGSTLPPEKYKNSDIDLTLKSLLPNGVKINITVDHSRLSSNLTTNKTKRFTKNISSTHFNVYQSHSRVLSHIKGFIQKIPGTYKSQKTD